MSDKMFECKPETVYGHFQFDFAAFSVSTDTFFLTCHYC